MTSYQLHLHESKITHGREKEKGKKKPLQPRSLKLNLSLINHQKQNSPPANWVYIELARSLIRISLGFEQPSNCKNRDLGGVICKNRHRTMISRMAVGETPSPSLDCLNFLMAMQHLRSLVRAKNTSPYVPSPILPTRSYCCNHAGRFPPPEPRPSPIADAGQSFSPLRPLFFAPSPSPLALSVLSISPLRATTRRLGAYSVSTRLSMVPESEHKLYMTHWLETRNADIFAPPRWSRNLEFAP